MAMKWMLAIASLVALAACGGGGGTPPPPPPPTQSYAVSPSTVMDSFTAGAPTAATVTLKPSQPLPGTVYFAIGDAGGAIDVNATVTANTDGSYTLTVNPLATLVAGSHRGNFTVTVCSDQACKSQLAGSPVTVPFDFEVAAVPAPVTLSPSALTGNFVAGDAFPFRLNTLATPIQGAPAIQAFMAADPIGTITPNVWFVQSNGKWALALTASPTLAAGHYTGTVQLRVCSDTSCTLQVGGSPLVVPYDIQVAAKPANSGLTALNVQPGVPAWEMFQGNAAHTGYVPVTIDPTKFATRWLWSAPGPPSTVTVENGILYVVSKPYLYALRESDMSLVWLHDFSDVIAGSGFGSLVVINPPTVSGGAVYVTTAAQQFTYMFAFDAATGSQLFQSQMVAQWEHYLAPTVYGGVVYDDGGTYGGMFAFNATSGAQLFFANLQQFDYWTPAVDANYAYVYIGGQTANTPAQLNVLDRQTGTQVAQILDNSYQWDGYSMYGSPVIGAPGSVVATNTGNPGSNELIDFDIAASSIRWHVPGHFRGNPAYHAGVFYALTGSPQYLPSSVPVALEARSEADGSLLWSWAAPASNVITQWQSDVLLTDNLVFVSTDSATYAIDLTTHQAAWTLHYPGRFAISDRGVFYLSLTDPLIPQNGWVAAINFR
jgi:hypothetical protein